MRLIDADELVRDLMEQIPLAENVPIFKEIIENHPTAYDIDKVVEELFNKAEFYQDENAKLMQVISLNEAIEIVKQGLKEQK